jgi:hypothetical protein
MQFRASSYHMNTTGSSIKRADSVETIHSVLFVSPSATIPHPHVVLPLSRVAISAWTGRDCRPKPLRLSTHVRPPQLASDMKGRLRHVLRSLREQVSCTLCANARLRNLTCHLMASTNESGAKSGGLDVRRLTAKDRLCQVEIRMARSSASGSQAATLYGRQIAPSKHGQAGVSHCMSSLRTRNLKYDGRAYRCGRRHRTVRRRHARAPTTYVGVRETQHCSRRNSV